MTEIEKLVELERAATPGPWYVDEERQAVRGRQHFVTNGKFNISGECSETNAAFIAAARTAVPALLAALKGAEGVPKVEAGTVELATQALTVAEDILSRAPHSTQIAANGLHPQTVISLIRDALTGLTALPTRPREQDGAEPVSLTRDEQRLVMNALESSSPLLYEVPAASFQAGAEVWNYDMATAPRDGTEILAFCDGFGLGHMVLYWLDGYWREKANGMGLKFAPTYWMPLPAGSLPIPASSEGR